MKQYKVTLYSNFTNLTTNEYVKFNDFVDEETITQRINSKYNDNIISVIDIQKCKIIY